MELKVNEKARRRAMHMIVSSAVIVLLFFTSLFLFSVAAFIGASAVFMYILFAAISLCFGIVMAYVMEDSPKPGHITEAGILMTIPVLFLINLVIPLLNNLNKLLAEVAFLAAEKGMGSMSLASLFNQYLPNPIALSLVILVFFNVPLAYLLVKRDDKKELWWYLIAPVVLLVIVYGSQFLVDAISSGWGI